MVETTSHTISLPKEWYAEKILKALKELEQGQIGVYQTDLWKLFHKTYSQEFKNGPDDPIEAFKFDEQVMALYHAGTDGIYFSEDCNKLSSTLQEGFVTFNQNLKRKHPNYEMNPQSGLIIPTNCIDLAELKGVLAGPASQNPSDDPSLSFVKNCRQHVAYTSYSRSGNTFLRSYLEKLSGSFTGSDGDCNASLHYSLQHNGFSGEAMTGENVWIVKTHYPLGKDQLVKASKVLCCVRNPMDVATSMFNFWATQTQNKSVSDQDGFYKTKEWVDLLKQEITLWRDFHRYWREEPNVHFLRFEDLLGDPKATLTGIFKFLLARDSLENTEIERRIAKVEAEAKPQLYKPRTGSSNKNAGKFEGHMDFVEETMAELTAFFDYSSTFGKEKTEGGVTFREHNDKVLEKILKEGDPQEEVPLEGKNIRSESDPACESYSDRNLKNFNFLWLKYSPKD